MLEGEALLSLVRRLMKSREKNKRFVILVDARVLLGAVARGRSSSGRLNRILRRLTAICLRQGYYLEVVWVPS